MRPPCTGIRVTTHPLSESASANAVMSAHSCPLVDSVDMSQVAISTTSVGKGTQEEWLGARPYFARRTAPYWVPGTKVQQCPARDVDCVQPVGGTADSGSVLHRRRPEDRSGTERHSQ